MRCLRALMCGKAVISLHEHRSAIPDDVLRRLFQLPTLESLLRMKRLKWLQHIGRFPLDHLMLLIALTAKFSWEPEPQLTPALFPSVVANPWL